MKRELLYALIGAAGLTLAACDKSKPPVPKAAEPQKDVITPTPAPPMKPDSPALAQPKSDAPSPMKK